MTWILKWLGWEFKITMINMFKALVEEVDKEHMDNVNRETETLRKK